MTYSEITAEIIEENKGLTDKDDSKTKEEMDVQNAKYSRQNSKMPRNNKKIFYEELK